MVVIIVFSGCKKFKKEGSLNQQGIVLTFDDDRIDNWFKYLPLLDSAGAKATFYVCKYNRLTADQKNKLHIIQSHGHEIAYHTISHYNTVDYIYKYHHTIDEFIQKEIVCGLKMMNNDGFYPTTFAYPYGTHNAVINKALKRYFKSVRALNGSYDYSKSLASGEKNDVLYGFGIDKGSNHSDVVLTQLLEAAKSYNACAVLVAHNINTNGRLSVSKERLLKIFSLVKSLGLKYYKAAEISN